MRCAASWLEQLHVKCACATSVFPFCSNRGCRIIQRCSSKESGVTISLDP